MKHMMLGLLIFLYLITPGTRAMAGINPVGKIIRMEGSAAIVREGKVLEGVVNAKIYPSDEIKTGPESLVELILLDGSSLHLGPDSSLELIQYKFSLMEANPSFIARMAKGIFVYISGAISKLHPGAVKFETPDGTVAIRGTKLVVKILEADIESVIKADAKPGPEGKTIIILFRDPAGNVGRVIISNLHGKRSLNRENYSVTISRNKAPTEQRFMDREALEQMIPPSLYPIVFENYAPPLAYTEQDQPLSDQENNFVLPAKGDPYSDSTP